MDELPPPKPFTWDREAQLIDDLWKMRVEKDQWKRLFILSATCLVMCLIICGIWLKVIWDMSEKEVNINFTPEMVRYTNSWVVQNNVQATHIPFSKHIITDVIDDKNWTWGDLWGHSMQPTFFEGNTMIGIPIKKYPLDIKTGDILRFYRTEDSSCPNISDSSDSQLGGTLVNNSLAVIHRVAAYYDDESIIMQGDNLYEQEVIKKCQVTDIVIGILFT